MISNSKKICMVLILVACALNSSCSLSCCAATGDVCKKIRVIDSTGNPIKSASAGGNPLAPSIMNSSNDQGYLVLSKYWENSDTGKVTIKAPGFHEFTRAFDDMEKVVVMKRING